MAHPSDLVEHYSTKAYQARVHALTFVGVALGISLFRGEADPERDFFAAVGLALLAVVASLAEMNRRYTYSYLCACRAAAHSDASGAWELFYLKNEAPWRSGGGPWWARARRLARRFLLSWSTYLPGLAAGWLLCRWGNNPRSLVIASWVSVLLLLWWAWHTIRPTDPDREALSKSSASAAGGG